MKRNTPFWIYIFLAILSVGVLVATLSACYTTLFGGRRTPYVPMRTPYLAESKKDLPDRASTPACAPGYLASTQIDFTLSRTVTPWNSPFAEESSKASEDFIP